MTSVHTREVILSCARKMVQAQGYNALSFRDLGAAVGVKSSSVHYYFSTKSELAKTLARQYTDEASQELNDVLEATSSPKECMQKYSKRFRAALENDNRMCLCGIMAAEYDGLPSEVKAEIERFNSVHIQWLMKVLSLKTSSLGKVAIKKRAVAIFAAFQGAQLIARGQNDLSLYDDTIAGLRDAQLLP